MDGSSAYISSTPPDTTIYVLGGYRSNTALFEAALEFIRRDATDLTGHKILVTLGDFIASDSIVFEREIERVRREYREATHPPNFVNANPNPTADGNAKGMIDLLRDPLLPDFELIHLRGRTEALFLDFLLGNSDEEKQGIGHNFQIIRNFESAFVKEEAFRNLSVAERRHLLRAAIPPEYIEFMQNLPTSANIGDYFFHSRLWVTDNATMRQKLVAENEEAPYSIATRDDVLAYDAMSEKLRAMNTQAKIILGTQISHDPFSTPRRYGNDRAAFDGPECIMLDSQNGGIGGLKLQGDRIKSLFIYDADKDAQPYSEPITKQKGRFGIIIRKEFYQATDGVVDRAVPIVTRNIKARVLRGDLTARPGATS